MCRSILQNGKWNFLKWSCVCVDSIRPVLESDKCVAYFKKFMHRYIVRPIWTSTCNTSHTPYDFVWCIARKLQRLTFDGFKILKKENVIHNFDTIENVLCIFIRWGRLHRYGDERKSRSVFDIHITNLILMLYASLRRLDWLAFM